MPLDQTMVMMVRSEKPKALGPEQTWKDMEGWWQREEDEAKQEEAKEGEVKEEEAKDEEAKETQ